MCHKKKIQFKDRRLTFTQTGSQFVYACAVDLRTNARKGERKPSMPISVRVLIFACESEFSSQLTI